MAINFFWIGMQNYNRQNIDGSINSYQQTKDPSHGYYVPFSDYNFLKQIESLILGSVILLNSKGIKTITSCHGHSFFKYCFRKGIKFNFGPQITVEVNPIDSYKIKKHFNTIFLTTMKNNTIESRKDNMHYISIRPRALLSSLMPNSVLCQIIESRCKELDYE